MSGNDSVVTSSPLEGGSIAAADGWRDFRILLLAGLWSMAAVVVFNVFESTLWHVLCWFWFMDGLIVMTWIIFGRPSEAGKGE